MRSFGQGAGAWRGKRVKRISCMFSAPIRVPKEKDSNGAKVKRESGRNEGGLIGFVLAACGESGVFITAYHSRS